MTILQRLKEIDNNAQAKIYFNKHSKINIELVIDAIENPSDPKEYAFKVPEDPAERVCETYYVFGERPLEEVISKTEKYMKDINIFDCVLIERYIEDGLTKDEIIKMLEFFKENEELLPVEINSDNSTAIGFITKTKANKIGYRYYEDNDFYNGIQNILYDMELESEDNIYDIPTEDGTTVHTYLTRNI